MEAGLESAAQAAPVVTKNEFTESSQENKVEQIGNGTIESSVKTEKTVTETVQAPTEATVQQRR